DRKYLTTLVCCLRATAPRDTPFFTVPVDPHLELLPKPPFFARHHAAQGLMSLCPVQEALFAPVCAPPRPPLV
ncbi:hypothetical protein CGCVW01_v010153, partial [Colletotrichum viniferum]